MLLRVDPDHAIISRTSRSGTIWVISRQGVEWNSQIALKGQFRTTDDGILLFRHSQGVAISDPGADFSLRHLERTSLDHPTATWRMCFPGVLVDPRCGLYAEYWLNREALKLPDPGYSEPDDALLLPDRRTVAITIVRSPHMALFNPFDRTTTLISLAGGYGNSNPILQDGMLYVNDYDRLCGIDLQTLEVRTSAVLQPPVLNADNASMVQMFIGASRFSNALNAWLVPRPGSGDILVVSRDMLEPVASLQCGGSPTDVVEFDDGSLLVFDDRFRTVIPARLSEIVPLPS